MKMDAHTIQDWADQIVQHALSYCAERYFQGDIYQLRSALGDRRREASMAFASKLGCLVAEQMGVLFPAARGVFTFEMDPSQLRVHEDALKIIDQEIINLLVWVEDRVPGDSTAVEKWIEALEDSQKALKIGPEAGYFIPVRVQIVDDQHVCGKEGLGVIPGSEVIRTKQVWPGRDEVPAGGVECQPEPTRENLLELLTTFDPKLAPEERILEHALAIERVPPGQRGALEYHLTELKVALIRKIISDQLSYINIARRWFTIQDLAELHERRIGYGRIGGKAAGMMLACRILAEVGDEQIRDAVSIPESYFLGSDLIYIFMAMNGLMHWNDQKYKPEEDIRGQHQQIVEEFRRGTFPPEFEAELSNILEKIGPQPLIVRSSSQLEDNFGTAFAGKYDSFFCANQGSPAENLSALTDAIARTYASTLKPEALLYRRRRGLQDYDERMAVLIQVVQGEAFGNYYLPDAAGVAFSRNLYRWSPEIRREDGFARLVWGLGTRAVGQFGDDYPRLVALGQPSLLPDDSAGAVRRYSQRCVDLIDLRENCFKSLPIHDVLKPGYPPLRYLAQLEEEGYFSTPRMRIRREDIPRLTLTFHDLLAKTNLAPLLQKILNTIESHYHDAVDMEFTLKIENPGTVNPVLKISLLQCRPQPHLQDVYAVRLPGDLPAEDVVFSTRFMVPRGYLTEVRYVLFVDPKAYYALPSPASRNQVSRAISALNSLLPEKQFVCIGPGRWGSSNTDLGVFVSYADIHNAGMLLELSGEGLGPAPEPSLGTHFFQDLMEAHIYPLALSLDDENSVFNRNFFYQTPSSLSEWMECDREVAETLRLIQTDHYRADHYVEIVMDDEARQAVAFLVKD